MIPVTQTTPFVPGPLLQGGKTPLSQSISGQPVMAEAILDWFSPMNIGVADVKIGDSSEPKTDGTAKTIYREVLTSGCMLPGDPETLSIKAEGERSWQSFVLYTTPDFNVDTDSPFRIGGQYYKVMKKKDYSVNGYVKYWAQEDYVRS